MNLKHVRSVVTCAHFELKDAEGQEYTVYRELVMKENQYGEWLIYALLPETAEEDDSGNSVVSGSLKVTHEESKKLFADMFAMIADPGSFGERKA